MRLYPIQLRKQLIVELHKLYILVGHDPFLLQESKNMLYTAARDKGFEEYHSFQIEKNTNWEKIFSLCTTISLFSKRQVIYLSLLDDNCNLFHNNIKKVIHLLHKDLLLIIQIGKNCKILQNNSTWFKAIVHKSITVMCQTPKQENLLFWLMSQAKQYSLDLDRDACQYLCYCYEGNLIGLSQILEQLSLLWKNKKLTLGCIQQIVDDSSRFSPTHLVDALLTAQKKRALHVLQQIRLEDSNLLLLLRILQREVLLLLTLKRQLNNTSLNVLLEKYSIWKTRYCIIKESLIRLKENQLCQAIKILLHIQYILYHDSDKNELVWMNLESLCYLFCFNESLK